MANIQNDIFENQEIANSLGKYAVSKEGDLTCATVNAGNIWSGTQEEYDELSETEKAGLLIAMIYED